MAETISSPRDGSLVDFTALLFSTGFPIDYTPADVDIPSNIKCVVFDADGTIAVKTKGGASAITGFPVLKGQPIPFIPGRITAMTGPTKCYLLPF